MVEPITSLVCNKGLKLVTSPLSVRKINQATKDFGNGHNPITIKSKKSPTSKEHEDKVEDEISIFFKNLLLNVVNGSSKEQTMTISFEILNKLLNEGKGKGSTNLVK